MVDVDARALILTLGLDEQSFRVLDALRIEHFPPERNLVPAHLTLFHALPADLAQALCQTLQTEAAQTPPIVLALTRPRYLGRGVALDVDSPELLKLRARLANQWSGLLSAQDRQRFRPHVTIQNKVSPTRARALYEALCDSWRPLTGRGEALRLWGYLGGPWASIAEFAFGKAGRGIESPQPCSGTLD